LDISDPARNETVEKKYKDIVNKILDKKTEYQEIGIATFDTEFRIVAPIGSSKEDLKKGLAEVKASGMATEFYKNILASIELLKKTQGDRKGLVIFSDGKDEDKNIEPIIWKPVFNTNTTNSPVSSPLVQPPAITTELGDSFFRDLSSVVPPSGPSLQPFTIKKTSVEASDTPNESTPQSDANVHKSKKKKKLKDKHKESPEKEKDKSKKKKKKKDKEKEKEKEKSQSNLDSSHNTSLSSSEQKKKDKKLKKLMKKEQKKVESSKEQQQERDESHHSATSTPETKETAQKKPPNLIEAVRLF
jgi:DNA polymerase III gamma/tau subunit